MTLPAELNWITAKTTSLLQHSDIHIWRVFIPDFASQLDQYWELLNYNEQQQAKKFVQNKHQNRYIIIHGILRQIIARYLNIDPKTITFSQNEFGKPGLSTTDAECLHFNISHSNDIALLAFGKSYPIGIDVEFRRKNIEITAITKKFFTANEANTINGLPPELQVEHFFNYWTCKEAFIKAIGEGLSYSLSKFEVDLKNLKIYINDPKYNAINWSLIKLDPFPDYSAAIAVAGEIKKLSLFNFDAT